jgi:organic radical activating enzyme
MKLQRLTTSLCSVCYKEVPAVVTVNPQGVQMEKECSAHGRQTSLVEHDPVFYTYVMGLKSATIYAGYFVDVTRQCNLRCRYCYYHLEQGEPVGLELDAIVQECRVNSHLGPFILTGGEPTLRPDLPVIIEQVSRYGGVELLTNGIRLAEREYFDQLMSMPQILGDSGCANVNLSIHPETDKWRDVIAHARAAGIKLESALLVVDSQASFLKAVALAKELSDVVMAFRLKAASRIWAEQKPTEKIFVSDMLHWLEGAGMEVRLLTVVGRENKSVFVNTLVEGVNLMLVSWHDVTNVDLHEINCPPFYRARNGEVANFVTAGLINEGMGRGWLKGWRL